MVPAADHQELAMGHLPRNFDDLAPALYGMRINYQDFLPSLGDSVIIRVQQWFDDLHGFFE